MAPRRSRWRPRLALPVLCAVLACSTLAACARDDARIGTDTTSPAAGPKKGDGKDGDGKKGNGNKNDDEEGNGTGDPAKKACPDPTAFEPAEAKATALIEGGDGEPRVDAVVYPHADHEGRPWSQWGQGLAPSAGRFVSAIGDSCGINGDAYVYVYDAEDRELRVTSDALSLVDHEDGAWGYGKVHGQVVAGPDRDLYAMTYWGSHDGLVYEDGYEGDLLLRIDPATGAATSLGVILPGYGTPSLASAPDHGLLYGEAVDPATSDPKTGVFFVYDVAAEEVVFTIDKGETKGYRNVLVDDEERAWFSTGAGQLSVYDPETGDVTDADVTLPGEYLRASSRPAPDGTVYGVTREPDVLFALHPDGELDVLGPVRGYVASLALSPDGRTLYYVPDAHGVAWEQGTPLIAVDTSSGDESVVVELNDAAEAKLDLRLGGSYNIAVDPSGDRVYVGLNAGPTDSDDTFGEVVLAIVELP